jgi:hypothetical protein
MDAGMGRKVNAVPQTLFDFLLSEHADARPANVDFPSVEQRKNNGGFRDPPLLHADGGVAGEIDGKREVAFH